MSRKRSLLFFLTLFFLSSYSRAQNPNWSGIIASSRAINWANAGVPGGIPDASWTQCGSTIAAYGTSGSPASPSTITNAITACGADHYVLLGAGIFYLNAPIDFAGASNVVLRGSGADQTKIVLISNSAACHQGFGGAVCIEAEINASQYGNITAADWTAGYTVGTTSITLSVTTGLAVGMLIALDQCDDGFTGSGAGSNFKGGCGTGSNVDTGNIWNCVSPTTNGGVCSSYSAGGGNRTNRSQQQWVKVTNISGSTVTISPGLYMSNWRTGQSPGAWWPTTSGGTPLYVTNDGVENITFDMTNYTPSPSQSSAVVLNWAYGCWVTGNRIINTERNHVFIVDAAHITVQNNYIFGTQNATDESYGIEDYAGSDNLIVNNIGQHIVTPYITGGADEGDVWAYNYDIDDYYSTDANWFMPGDYQHAAGSAMDLWEGNEGSGFIADSIHGTHNLTTGFRNYWIGNQASCYGAPCGQEIFAIQPQYVTRYYNFIGNVLGNGTQTAYNDNPTSGSSPGGAGLFGIYAAGWAGQNATYTSAVGPANDMLSLTSRMLWGNYDTVNASVQWNASEVPSNFNDTSGSPSRYVNPVPNSQSLPSSFYSNSQPAFWADGIGQSSIPWPPIGPDVSGGDIPNAGGHANHIPAELCYVNSPVDQNYQNSYSVISASWSSGTETLTFAGGTFSSSLLPQGEIRISGANPGALNGTYQITGSTTATVKFAIASNPGSFVSGAMLYPNVRLFNANNCYGGSTPPVPPTQLTAVVQ